MQKKTLGSLLKNKGFQAVLESLESMDEKSIKSYMATSEDSPISELNKLLFFVPDYFYPLDEDGNPKLEIQEKVYDFLLWLKEHGGEPNATVKHGVSCFLKSAQLPKSDLIKFLMDNFDIQMQQSDNRGMDAIIYSIIGNSQENFDFFAAQPDFDVNKKYVFLDNKTLLHVACELGNEIIIDKLIALGGDLNALDDNDQKPAEFIPTAESCNFLTEEEITEEKLASWDALFSKLEEISSQKVLPKKSYKTSF